MIQWHKLDRTKPPKLGSEYLISDGKNVDVALFADDIWFVPDRGPIDGESAITHYAEINLPQ